MDSIKAYLDVSQEYVTGWVKMKTYKGGQRVIARDSPFALYNHKLATYDMGSSFNQLDSPGFINLFGLSTTLASKIRKTELDKLNQIKI